MGICYNKINIYLFESIIKYEYSFMLFVYKSLNNDITL